MNRRNILILLLALIMSFGLVSCGKHYAEGDPIKLNEGEVQLNVFVPDGGLAIIAEAAELYHAEYPYVIVKIEHVPNSDSDELTAKVQAGYDCDIYVADEARLMDWLDPEAGEDANPNGNDCIDPATRIEAYQVPADVSLTGEETTYTMAVTRSTGTPDEAARFVRFVVSDVMDEVYEEYGWTKL